MAASNGSEYFDLDVEAQNESFGRRSNAESVEEDEHELLWAALEKLPTRKRTNFALVKRDEEESNPDDSKGKTDTVDVRNLDRDTRQLVVSRAMATSAQDNYKLLAGVKERLDRYFSFHTLSLLVLRMCIQLSLSLHESNVIQISLILSFSEKGFCLQNFVDTGIAISASFSY